ncbi:MAG: Eco57I restriction-modification methylase domain-containing protein [Terriglobia bacterium]
MASLLTFDTPIGFRLLDPGAGIGALSAAICDRFAVLQPCRYLHIDLIENDLGVIPFLRQVMGRCSGALKEHGHSMSYEIHAEDFILDTAASVFAPLTLFDKLSEWGDFDCVIMNPPYFKVSGVSQYARVMRDIVHGQPNIYAFFLAAAARLLRPNGELVAITPRSFCNGLYFRSFRQWLFERMALDHIHLFESRKETFRNVLQESLITVYHRLGEPSPQVTITTSFGPSLRPAESRILPTSTVIDNNRGHAIIRIPATDEDVAISALVESWPDHFSDVGLRISTGPVVMFRATEFLLPWPNNENSTPLFSVYNVKPFQTEWPVFHKNHPAALKVCPESQRLLLPTRNYVLLRRFSAKEEHRRLMASCLLASDVPTRFVALENHLNYVYHAERDLTPDEAYGITAVFNSSLLDRYFRIISGNTQVNATEIRNMKFPSLSLVGMIGSRIRRLSAFDSDLAQRIVFSELSVNGEIAKHLMEGTLFGRT